MEDSLPLFTYGSTDHSDHSNSLYRANDGRRHNTSRRGGSSDRRDSRDDRRHQPYSVSKKSHRDSLPSKENVASSVEHNIVMNKEAWSIKTFFEFYDRVLGEKIFDHFGQVISEACVAQNAMDDEKSNPSNVLEVAAGTGRITKHLLQQLTESSQEGDFKLTATDMSAAAIEEAKKVLGLEVTQNPNLELLPDVDMAEMPFEEDRMDAIVCGFGIMFPKDKVKLAREFRRVLQPGGRFYATVFHRNHWFELVQKECMEHFGQESKMVDAALGLNDPTIILDIFRQEGFSVELEELSHDFPVTRADTKELLINSCVLLEEFNQSTPANQARVLKQMTDSIHGLDEVKNVGVKVWLLNGSKNAEFVNCASKLRTRLDLAPFRSFVAASPDEKAQICNEQKEMFLSTHGKTYDWDAVTAFRAKEFARLDCNREIYLDYVGGSLPPRSLLERQFDSIGKSILGNPHSHGKASANSLDHLKVWVKRLFNCEDNDDYEMIFTANASAATTIVAECFPFQQGSSFVLTKDNHTSVHSIREFAKEKGAETRYVTVTEDLLIWDTSMNRAFQDADKTKNNLLAYPAQSNATGARHDLKWVKEAQDSGFQVLLDVAAYIPTSRMDLSAGSSCRPDFLCMSFYKLFGFPTGIGCLLAKKSSLASLVPTGLKSGSVCYFSGPWSPTKRVLRYGDDRKFEHGTPNYMAFDHVSQGIEFLLNFGVETVQRRSYALARWLESSLAEIQHSNGSRLVLVYPPAPELKGATVMFNFYDPSGSVYPFTAVDAVAAARGNIKIRSGCFCNTGIVQHATYTDAGAEHCELDKKGEQILSCSRFGDEVLSAGHCGAMRLSFGLGSNFYDAYSFYLFARAFLDTDVSAVKREL